MPFLIMTTRRERHNAIDTFSVADSETQLIPLKIWSDKMGLTMRAFELKEVKIK